MLCKTSQLIYVVVINVSFYNLFAYYYCNAYPLSTQDRWIIDESTGQRLKLVCANWASHLQPMIPEGLDKQPLRFLVAQVVKNKFNCIRLTYAVYMWTRYGNHIVEDTLKYLDIPEVVKGIEKSNPSLLKMTHIQVFDLLIKELGAYNVKVLLDNHVSEPKWCCNKNDDNGFFNDRNFKPVEWLQGLDLAAKHFSANSAVVAMSLRNELRGPRQNEGDWYNYMAQGAAAIHKANAEVLVVVSGLNYDTEFQFLKKKPMKIDIGKKLVYETHLYSWSGVGTLKLKDIWTSQPLNRICANSIEGLENQAGFLTTGKNAAPLILSEFGFDQLGSTVSDNKFLTCLQTYLVEKDLDWCLWAFHGGYYLREDKIHSDESFGVLDSSWKSLRYPNFTEKFQLLQRKNQDPSSRSSNEYILYHPLSGQCVQVNRKNRVEVGSCRTKDRWIHDTNGTHNIILVSNKKCLTATREGIPAMISDDCNKSSWKYVSLSKLHLATTDQNGNQFCLQKDSNSSKIVTAKCVCIRDDSTCLDDPQNQWFKFVPTNV